jgi:hypothetical protein
MARISHISHFIRLIVLLLLLGGCANPSLVRDLKARNMTYLNTTKVVIRGSQADVGADVVVEVASQFVIQAIWDMIYLSRPYDRWAMSGYRILELYTHDDTTIPDVVLLVNETDKTQIEGNDDAQGYRCPGLDEYLMEFLRPEYKRRNVP